MKIVSKWNTGITSEENIIRSDGLRFLDNWLGQYSICQLGEEYFDPTNVMISTISKDYIKEEEKELSGFMSIQEFETKRMELTERLFKNNEFLRRFYDIKS